VDLEDGRTRRETSFDFLLGEKRHRINSRSCFDPQFVGIIALPLSGFVMDIGDGFVKTKQNPQVNGFEYDNFNVRNTEDIPASLFSGRKSLPTDDAVSQIFLAPQAEALITGNTWGQTVNYNCLVVTNSSDFTVLNLRNGSKTVFPGSNTFQYFNPINDTIGIYNQPNSLLSFAREQNLEAVMEFGFSSRPKSPMVYNPSSSNSCYYNAKTDVAGRYPAFDQELVVEAILWQHFQP
ncbi:hypothetical protein F5882DRAFT_495125, partial [Hyaloscypha sp. PMI_1271]